MTTTVNQANTQIAAKVQTLSLPNILLRLEGLTMFAAAVVLYAHQGGSLLLFLALILVPDVSMLGYMVNVRVGSLMYNAAHLYTIPAVLAGVALAMNIPTLLLVALIWFAHIGIDRLAGFGLKYPTEFKDTHMQRV
ncbi:MAG: DUF4260 domain-containing protein [Chloroflexi bacterium]|nr:DUF4260 domain-containing protein [Chloroflexota bacterium]MCC6895888.1 DUF4260 domain-containing protein [Anaerolineae bacterium]